MQKLFNVSIFMLGTLIHMQQLHCSEQPTIHVQQASSTQQISQNMETLSANQKIYDSSQAINRRNKRRQRKKRVNKAVRGICIGIVSWVVAAILVPVTYIATRLFVAVVKW